MNAKKQPIALGAALVPTAVVHTLVSASQVSQKSQEIVKTSTNARELGMAVTSTQHARTPLDPFCVSARVATAETAPSVLISMNVKQLTKFALLTPPVLTNRDHTAASVRLVSVEMEKPVNKSNNVQTMTMLVIQMQFVTGPVECAYANVVFREMDANALRKVRASSRICITLSFVLFSCCLLGKAWLIIAFFSSVTTTAARLRYLRQAWTDYTFFFKGRFFRFDNTY